MSKVAGYQTRNWFISGRVEESTGDYFALIKRDEEAKEGYEEALAAYDRVLPSDPDFAAAQQHKARVRKKLEEHQDELLLKLLKDVLHYPTGSRYRDQAVGSLVKLIPHLPGVWKRQYPRIDYQEALFRAYEDICLNLGRFLQRVNLDIETADAKVIREAFVRRFNILLKENFVYLYRQVRDDLSLDIPINREESGITLADELYAPALMGLEGLLKQEVQHVVLKLMVYIETDPKERLRNCHLPHYPQCNCQELAQRRLLKDPPDRWAEIAKDLEVPLYSVSYSWQKKCVPLLQKIAEELGSQPE